MADTQKKVDSKSGRNGITCADYVFTQHSVPCVTHLSSPLFSNTHFNINLPSKRQWNAAPATFLYSSHPPPRVS
jgi:hypothetical protein